MLTIIGWGRRACDGVSRRQLLQAGGIGLLGLSLPRVLAAEQLSAGARGRAKSVIFLFLFGGPSQLETFDLKPEAPSSIRGPFKPIKTSSPDIQISEIFPKMAKHADKFSLVRSCYHTAAAVTPTRTSSQSATVTGKRRTSAFIFILEASLR